MWTARRAPPLTAAPPARRLRGTPFVQACASQPVFLLAAFWTALASIARSPAGASPVRCVAGLALGAALAHAGFALLQAPALAALPVHTWLDPTRGFCVLFVPLGPFLVAPRRGPERDAFLAASLSALPLALAVARVGCLAAGCCHGLATDLPWGIAAGGGARVHPTPLYEVVGLLAFRRVLGACPEAWIAPVFALGFGAVRLAVEPWRAPPPLGPPVVPPAAIALAWIALSPLFASRAPRAPGSRSPSPPPWPRSGRA